MEIEAQCKRIEEALKKIDISLYDSYGKMRSFLLVMQELNVVWGLTSKEQQNEIIRSFRMCLRIK